MWLLTTAVRQAIEQAQTNGVAPSPEQQAAYESRYGDGGTTGSTAKPKIENGVAHITVEGVLTPAPDFLASLFGGGNTTYTSIISALSEAEADSNVERVRMFIDSPGGNISGLFDTVAAMEAFSKPIDAVVGFQAASAAYVLASKADTITAVNKASSVGSIGVVRGMYLDKNKVEITNTKSPLKRPDASTEEGREAIREDLDAYHDLFADVIADGRGVTVDKLNADFGQGRTFLAEDAKKRGMIDAIAGPTLSVVKSSSHTTTANTSGNQPETGNMDLKTLQAQHPDVYAAAVQIGTDKERDRVSAHLEMGEAANALDIAVTAIKDGEEYTSRHMASYNAAALRVRDQRAAESDDAAAAAALAGADNPDTNAAVDESETVMSAIERQFGIAGEA